MINVPTLPLEFLLAERQARFRFKAAGEATMNGVKVLIISFEERERPTLIRTPTGDNVRPIQIAATARYRNYRRFETKAPLIR